MPMHRLDMAMRDTAARIEGELDRLLPPLRDGGVPERLAAAMRHAALGGGKRLRPFLLLHSAALFDADEKAALRAACALEMVHCYSLVHDDLPAMDDDDLRRGKPTVHKEFDEATAILAGDALLTLAFELLADGEAIADPLTRAGLIGELARDAGAGGMAGGQMLDLAGIRAATDIRAVIRLQRMKTGRLITFACVAGGMLGRAPAAARAALRGYAGDIGLAFQIADDLLDAAGDEAEAGKRLGKDADHGKATFISLLGAAGAEARARKLAARAAGRLAIFGEKADLLQRLAGFIVDRRH